jgi:hypothetical protein
MTQAEAIAKAKEADRTVEIAPAVFALLMFLVDGDREKRSLDYWLEEALVRGYNYHKRLRENQEQKRDAAEAKKEKEDFNKVLSSDPSIFGKPEMLLQLARTYHQLDSIVVQALLAKLGKTSPDAEGEAEAA